MLPPAGVGPGHEAPGPDGGPPGAPAKRHHPHCLPANPHLPKTVTLVKTDTAFQAVILWTRPYDGRHREQRVRTGFLLTGRGSAGTKQRREQLVWRISGEPLAGDHLRTFKLCERERRLM